MKILFYNHTGQVGGAERVLMTIVRNLEHTGFQLTVVCPAGPLREQLEESAIPTEVADTLNARFTLRPDHLIRYLTSFVGVIRQLRRRVVRSDPDLIHANSVRAGLAMTIATMGLRKPVLWHVHDLLPRYHPFNPLIRLFAFVSRQTRIIAVAQASGERFSRSVLPLKNRVTVIRNGIDTEKFRPCAVIRRAIRKELNFRDDQKLLGVIGRLTPSKGQLELIRAFAAVRHKFPDVKLLIVGAPAFNREQAYAELLESTVRDLGIADCVRFLGERNDVSSLMQALDLLVLNSSSEACSLVLLEAMAAGLPVIATSVGGTREIIEHKETGWLVPSHDDKLLAESLVTMFHDDALRVRLRNNARQFITARFCESRFLKEITGYYAQFQHSEAIDFTRSFVSKKMAAD